MSISTQPVITAARETAELVLPQYPDVHIHLSFAQEQNADIPKRVREILKRSYLERNAICEVH